MDLKDIAQRSKASVHLRHPVTAVPLFNETFDGEGKVVARDPVTIDVLSTDSDLYRRRRRERVNKMRANAEENGSLYLTAEDDEAITFMVLSDVTVGWNIIVDGATPNAADDDAKVKFYSDPRFGWVCQQVRAFADSRANFIGGSSAISSGTQSAGQTDSA